MLTIFRGRPSRRQQPRRCVKRGASSRHRLLQAIYKWQQTTSSAASSRGAHPRIHRISLPSRQLSTPPHLPPGWFALVMRLGPIDNILPFDSKRFNPTCAHFQRVTCHNQGQSKFKHKALAKLGTSLTLSSLRFLDAFASLVSFCNVSRARPRGLGRCRV